MVMLNHDLRIFLKVSETGSMTEAANALYISQPAVSKAIKTLEEEWKLKLFYRNRRTGLHLTETGQEILLLARQMAELENRIYQIALRSNHLMGGTVRIASMPILTSVILADVLHRFREQHPPVAVELVEGSSMEIRRAVEEHRVDFALVSGPFGALDHEVLFQDRMIAVSREPLADTLEIALEEEPQRFIFCKAGHETAMEILRARRMDMTKSFLVEQAETVIRLAEARNGIGVLSELVVEHTSNHLFRYPVKPEISIDIGLAANDLGDLPPAAAVLKQMIADFVREKAGNLSEKPVAGCVGI